MKRRERETETEREFPRTKDKLDDDMGVNKSGNKGHEEQLAVTS